MTTEQTPSIDEDSVIQLEASDTAGKCILCRDSFFIMGFFNLVDGTESNQFNR